MTTITFPAPEPTLTESQLKAKLHKAHKENMRRYALAWRNAQAAGIARRQRAAILADAISCRKMAKRYQAA